MARVRARVGEHLFIVWETAIAHLLVSGTSSRGGVDKLCAESKIVIVITIIRKMAPDVKKEIWLVSRWKLQVCMSAVESGIN